MRMWTTFWKVGPQMLQGNAIHAGNSADPLWILGEVLKARWHFIDCIEMYIS